MRLILQQRDEIARLEQRLDELDSAESRHIFLGCMRRDQKPDRRQILQELKVALSEYGKRYTVPSGWVVN